MTDNEVTLDDVLVELGLTAKWKEEGREKGREEIARKLLRKGWSIEDTAETAELDIETVKSLLVIP
jgi:predicted transposase YdaD